VTAGETSAVDEARRSYAAELRRWRRRRRLTQRELAEAMPYDRSYVSQVENARMAPSDAFTERAEAVLGCGGALRTLWEECDDARYDRGRQIAGLRSALRPDERQRVVEQVAQLVLDQVAGGLAGWLSSMQEQIDSLRAQTDGAAVEQINDGGRRRVEGGEAA
jgi:transcriptional regulator with XRE-family HTH domain